MSQLSIPRVPCPFSPSRTFVDERRLNTHLVKKHPSHLIGGNQSSTDNEPIRLIKEKLIDAKSNCQVLNRIPKGARFSVADKLCSVIRNCVQSNSVQAWSDLLLFSYMVLCTDQKKKNNLTTKIKQNVSRFVMPTTTLSSRPREIPLSKRVEAKVEAFDLKGAVRILSSSDTVAPHDANTICALQEKHPAADQDLILPDLPPDDMMVLVVDEKSVMKAILSFPNGSAGGLDGLKPQFLKDLTSFSAGEAGRRVLTAITDLCNFILSGYHIPTNPYPYFYWLF
uniref:Uncharacterized protein n=1 Tax=Cacopsylla melanoneura TaxID=428564 RepID=A0A8D8Z2S3_9HEMI